MTLDLEALWRHSFEAVIPTVSSPAQRQWLAATRPVGFSHDTVFLATPHSFAREWLETRCGTRLHEAFSRSAGRAITVVITVQPRPEPVAPTVGEAALQEPSAERTPAEAEPWHPGGPETVEVDITAEDGDVDSDESEPYGDRSPAALEAPGRPAGPSVVLSRPELPARVPAGFEAQLNPKYVFDDFVVGASNRFAWAAANAVAEQPAKAYNPLFIYGGAGLGKTHLLHAIGHYARNLYPRLTIRYVTTEQFTNDFINAIRDDRIPVFQRTYRQIDVLLMDDIQFLESKERTQEEFFHTFNDLHNSEKQIVVSSDRPPKQIGDMENRLRSRFEWGLMTDVQPPDLETRIAILRKKCGTDRLAIPDEVLEHIASKVDSNIRELEGSLIRITAFSSLQQSAPDLAMAETVLKDLFPDADAKQIGIQLIMEVVADYFQVTLEELSSASRSRQLVTARQIAMYLARELTDLSLPRIGKVFGGRDHTTVMHAKTKIATLMQERRAIYDQVQELTNRIKTHARTP